jgi:Zn-dependent peptidase ImmA (M78 family)
MKWTAEKLSMLRAEYAYADLQVLAHRLEVSVRALKSKAVKLGLRRGRGHHHWTAEELDMLGLLYPDNSNRGIAETLGVSASCIENKAHALGLRKSERYLSRMTALRSQHPSVRASQFKAGHEPFNKGIPQSRWMRRDGRERKMQSEPVSSPDML